MAADMCAKLLQSCLNLCDIMNCSPPGSSVHGKQEYWSGLPFPPSGDLPNPGIEPASHVCTLAGVFPTTSATWEVSFMTTGYCLKVNKFYKTTKKEKVLFSTLLATLGLTFPHSSIWLNRSHKCLL